MGTQRYIQWDQTTAGKIPSKIPLADLHFLPLPLSGQSGQKRSLVAFIVIKMVNKYLFSMIIESYFLHHTEQPTTHIGVIQNQK
ncbi:MAG: hypothetical protein ACSLEN_10150 [Candidatus Malihini olakiniferum]